MTEISKSNRMIARMTAKAFGSSPEVHRYWDGDHRSSVDILSCKDSLQPNVTSAATVGLSDWPLYQNDTEYPARVELLGACGAEYGKFANILSTAAFCVINSKWFCFPGAIFQDIVKIYYDSFDVKHLLFVPPFLWESGFETIELPDKTVAWLLMVPISEAEYQFANEYSSNKLEEEFVQNQIDVLNLQRPSIF